MDSEEQQAVMKKYWHKTTVTLPKAMWIEAKCAPDCTIPKFLEIGEWRYNKSFESTEKELISMKASLEIGCGIGRLVFPTCERFETSYGIDISENMIKYANEIKESNSAYSSAQFYVTKGTGEIPLDDESISYVYSFICFQHIPYVEIQLKYILEIDRILVDGGLAKLLISHANNKGNCATYTGVSKEQISSVLSKKDTKVLKKETHDNKNYWLFLKKKKVL